MFRSNPYYAKSDIQGRLVAILDGRLENRGLELITQISRCVRRNDVHELIASDEPGLGAGSKVEKVAYLGFLEINRAGVLIIGDEVFWAGRALGVIAGFDETHAPNHLNIVVSTRERLSGADLKLNLGDSITFRPGQS
jgi:hypothetical protein